MVKFKKLWLFERSEFYRFLTFIIAQSIAGIRPSSEIYYQNIYNRVCAKIRDEKVPFCNIF